MLRANMFPELEIDELSSASLEFDLVGKASIASRQMELFGTMTAISQMSQIAQLNPEIFDNVNVDKTARFIQEVNMMPIDLQLSEEQVQEIRNGRAEAAAAQQQAAQAQALSDAYVKTTKAPEQGSGAEFIQQIVNQGAEES
jgi:hypothetical protein